MPREVMKELVESIGYCCIRAYLKDNKKKGTREKAKRLGVARQQIQYWNRKLRDGTCRCTRQKNCELRANR